MLCSTTISHPDPPTPQVGITRFNTFCPATRGRFAMGEQRPCAREVLPDVSNSSGGVLDAYSVLASQHLSMEEHAGYRWAAGGG
jgi:hypothetical protein